MSQLSPILYETGSVSGIILESGSLVHVSGNVSRLALSGTVSALSSSWTTFSGSTFPAFSSSVSSSFAQASASIVSLSSSFSSSLSLKVDRSGDSMTGPLGINRSGGAINATDLHVGAGNYSLAGSVSVRYEPSIASPGNYPRTQWFHPIYAGNVGVNAIALQIAPELSSGKSCPTMYGLGITHLNAGTLTNWCGIIVYDSGVTAPTNKYDALFLGGGNVGIGTSTPSALLHVSGSSKLGGDGTAILGIKIYLPTLTPAAVILPGTTQTETFSVSGLSTSDSISLNPPAQTSGVVVAQYRVSATNTLEIVWANVLAVGSLTPAAGIYRVLAIRS